MTIGYQQDFIGDGIMVPVPGFSAVLTDAVYRDASLREEIYLDYIHYSLVMNKTTRQLVFSASNIDQNKHIQINRKESRGWEADDRLDDVRQLDNRFYKANDWDRGHMVQRNNNCWAANRGKALEANNATFFYTNAAFQHKYFNRDEWLKLEDYIGALKGDSNGQLCVFTGPVHLPFDRQYARSWHDTVRVPSAFFKMVCYKSKTTEKLETRAFLLYQDAEFIGNKQKGAGRIKLKNYQCTVTEIQKLTGLKFSRDIVQSNPLYYSAPETLSDGLTINSYPERIPVEHHADIVTGINQPRVTQEVAEKDKAIVIAAAMVNPAGSNERLNEWITLLNISAADVDVSGWRIEDQRSKVIYLSGLIEKGSASKVQMSDHAGFRLLNRGGTIILKNEKNEVVDRESYTQKDIENENMGLRF